MDSKIAAAIHLELEPVALIWADEKLEGAMEFAPGRWGCVMFLLAAAATGKTAVASRETFGCWGAGVGLGFGNHCQNFPGGEECFCRFLSTGNAGSEPGEAIGQPPPQKPRSSGSASAGGRKLAVARRTEQRSHHGRLRLFWSDGRPLVEDLG